ncbi:uncharacterized protein [Linepithema humile]|uniref:uncharacterized protein n=1 Tax=Linepithema humile TaxID=83485 RepID=UPI00351E3124
MGKSSHRSRKRKRSRSPSRDRLASLENKMSRLIEILTQSEVRAPNRPSSSVSLVSVADYQEAQRSGAEPDTPTQTRSELEGNLLASIVSQVGPADAQQETVQILDEGEGSPRSSKHVSLQENSLPGTSAPSGDTVGDLTSQLFGFDLEGDEVLPWNEIVTERWRVLSRKGLPADQREALLKRYSPPEAVSFLKAPTLNQECRVALKNNAIVKRDDFAARNQDQMGVALCALGEAVSDLFRPETQNCLNPEARLAITKVNEGAKILADLFYHLSLSRRAQITPALNLMAKNMADTIPVDDLLFGSSFGEQMKKAASMEKSSRDIVKATLSIPKKIQQPIKPPTLAPARSGNARAPARQSRATTRRTGAANNSRRSFRPRSRSRRR